MNAKNVSLIWGIALIVAGALFMAQNMGFIDQLSPLVWIAFFTGLSLLFFASYFLTGVQQWGWLFPACISGALALTIGLATSGIEDSAVGAPILASIAIPFGVAFALDQRKHWWALIPAWAMLVLAFITFLADRVQGEFIGSFFLLAIAMPFILVFLSDRKKKWALIPAGALLVIGVIPMLSLGLREELMGPVVMLLFALPFLVIYLMSERNFWAFIPAGFFATIAIGVLATGGRNYDLEKSGLIGGILFGGWALTFLVLWLRREVHGTDWAKYPAVGLALMAIVAFVIGTEALNIAWPLLIIGVGVWVLFNSFRKKSV